MPQVARMQCILAERAIHKTNREINTMNKTRLIPSLLIIICLLICQGCSGKTVPESHALTVDSSGTTGLGLHTGSSYDEWIGAYGSYEIQKYEGEDLVPFTPVTDEGDADTSDFADHDGRYMVSAFYIDDIPTSVDELCRSEGVKADALADYLASTEYLERHNVIFRYVIFTITDDVVSDIEFDYLDYNNEL